MTDNHDAALTYSSYLKVDELLKLQQPLSDGPEHDELLFIVIHQTYELWFKELIHEFKAAQRSLEAGDTHYSLSILGRIRTIMKICVAQIDEDKARVEALMKTRSIWESALRYVHSRGFAIPDQILNRDSSKHYEPNSDVQSSLLDMHRNDPEGSLICERLVDIDEGLQEWRYRHVKMVERTIGHKSGTGGSSGADYLASTLFKPVFPDLWEIRSKF
jgi:tryptophan 2,3-dioxygenase